MTKTTMIKKLLQVESELRLAIWRHETYEAPNDIINGMTEAWNLIFQAINKLEDE